MRVFPSQLPRVVVSLGCLGSCALIGCGTSDGAKSSAGNGPDGGTNGRDGATVGASRIKTVFLILMENKAWSEVKGSADATYLNDVILPAASVADGYMGPKGGNLHPSEPNYLWLEAGDNFGIVNDNDPAQNHQATTAHLVTLLESAGVTWRSYQEDIGGDVCPLTSIGQYKPKHDPMVFFDDVTNGNDATAERCVDHIRPLTKQPGEGAGGDFESDLASGTVGRYNFVTPNQCSDMHSVCAPLNNEIKQGDAWLETWIPKIQASSAYKEGGAILITWDEAELTSSCPTANCPVGMLALSPLAKGNGYTNTITYDHSSTLKSMQELFGVTPLLGAAADPAVVDLADLFVSFP